MTHDDDREPVEVGYRNPPRSTRFRKGHSGNPKGRPRGSGSKVPHDAVLGRMVTIREDGRERRVTAAQAFLLQLVRKGLEGDSNAARNAIEAIETARAKKLLSSAGTVFHIIVTEVSPQAVSNTLSRRCASRASLIATAKNPA
jgi:hypothetical protein